MSRKLFETYRQRLLEAQPIPPQSVAFASKLKPIVEEANDLMKAVNQLYGNDMYNSNIDDETRKVIDELHKNLHDFWFEMKKTPFANLMRGNDSTFEAPKPVVPQKQNKIVDKGNNRSK